MDGGSPHEQELLALRRAFLDIAELAQRATMRLDAYLAQRETQRPNVIAERSERYEWSENSEQADRAKCSSAVAEALRYMETHCEERISLARLAHAVGCSRSTLTRAFRRDLGQTAHAYLVRIRMSRAEAGVRMGEKIEAVMLGVGFRSKRNFYRQFKARFGRTPAGYRAQVTACRGESPP
jgi:transcriptional regulator GlxA family with amidase domain